MPIDVGLIGGWHLFETWHLFNIRRNTVVRVEVIEFLEILKK